MALCNSISNYELGSKHHVRTHINEHPCYTTDYITDFKNLKMIGAGNKHVKQVNCSLVQFNFRAAIFTLFLFCNLRVCMSPKDVCPSFFISIYNTNILPVDWKQVWDLDSGAPRMKSATQDRYLPDRSYPKQALVRPTIPKHSYWPDQTEFGQPWPYQTDFLQTTGPTD